MSEAAPEEPKKIVIEYTTASSFVFAVALVFRFLYTMFTSPMQNLYSDALRHWHNAKNFWSPEYFGSIDPIGYQLYLAAVQFLTGSDELGVTFFTALLSIALPVIWFFILKEFVPRTWAYLGAAFIALTPSLIMIYSYFMNETLLIVLHAIGILLTIRCRRNPSLWLFSVTALVWVASCYTRLISLPMAIICLGYIIYHVPGIKDRLIRMLAIGIFFVAGLWPACEHSRIHLNFCAPFGMPYLAEAYRAAQSQIIILQIEGGGGFGFASPSSITKVFSPLSNWHRPQEGERKITIDPQKGSQSWLDEIERMKQDPATELTWLEDFLVNGAIALFDPSWPDNNETYRMGAISIHARWMWFPLTLAVFLLGGRRFITMRRPSDFKRRDLVPLLAIIIMLALLFQKTGVMEGRYRKPAEPLLIAALVILVCGRKHKDREQHETQA